MPWIAPVVGAVAGGLMGGSSQGGTQTQSRDPWGPAQPWMQQNLKTGQDMQGRYAAQPFNPLQQQSYGNLFAGTDYINQMTPGLLAQFSQPAGFDRSNPHARPPAFAFPGMQQMQGQAPGMQPMSGLLAPSFQQAMSQGQQAPPEQPQQPPAWNPDPQQIAYLMQTIGAGG